ncbi:S8 family serine peptidase [Nonomuraea sp. CA-141351]|uniref:S8 family serine peptidase n=1 Tax=Nonomuraea sp. CA-141351 TaxID=3239996 RepID=UPI003D8D400B
MHHPGRALATAAAAALALALAAAPGTAAAAPETEAVPTARFATGPAVGTFAFTLITGDTVTAVADASGIVSFEAHPGPGRDDITFATHSDGPRELAVIPSDAMPMLAAGTLDQRLFEIGTLLDFGYDDVSRADLPLIVQAPGGLAKARAALSAATVKKDIPGLGVTTLTADKSRTGALWQQIAAGARLRSGVSKVWLDGKTRLTLDKSVPQVGAPTAWAAGYTGKGVTVAMLDSGYDSDHPMLAGRVTLAEDFTGVGSPEDDHGHGTHVLSTIGGSADSGYRGVAPDATLAVGKVCTNNGSCSDSAMIEGMTWAATTAGAKIVSMSLGGQDYAGVDPLEYTINQLSAQTGALFVVAAGNSGEAGLGTVESPGTADAALSVGAVDRSDALAYFSSRGPRLGDMAVKPEITGPGVGIVAARMGGGYVAMSGTSMATPHVAGVAALIAQQHPGWNGAKIKSALIGAAAPTAGLTPYHQGSGRVDAARAVGQQITASPANLSVKAGWGRQPGSEASHEVTYTNDGDSAVTLDLAVETPSSTGGAPGNPTMFTLDKQSVEVPAHGSAAVTVTIHDVMPRGAQAAALIARSGTTSVRTILADYTPIPSRKLTINSLDRAGQPAKGSVELYERYTGVNHYVSLTSGTGSISVPEGQYYAVHSVNTPSDGSRTLAIVPVTLDGDKSVTVDARLGTPVDVKVDDERAEGVALVASVLLPRLDGSRSYTVSASGTTDFGKVYLTPLDDPSVSYRTHATFAQKGATAAEPSPFFYHVTDLREGGVPADLSYRTGRDRLTAVRVEYRAQGAPSTGNSGSVPLDGHPTTMFDQPVAFPSQVVDYRTPGAWRDRIRVEGRMALEAAPREYGPDQRNRLVWNAGIIGPTMAIDGVARLGNVIGLNSSYGIQWFIDGESGSTGTDWGATGTLDLELDGKLIKRWSPVGLWQPTATVPAGRGTYTLRGTVLRDRPYAGISTRVETEWTFDSGATDDIEIVPLIAVRALAKGLDMSNYAKAGHQTKLAISVERSPGAAPSPARLTGLEVSFDDGATWQAVEVENGEAKVRNPDAEGFVSLRAKAADEAGNTVVQTIMRAYGVR